MDTPNSITGRPGSTYRVNDANGEPVARVSRMVGSGPWGPAGWYDQKSMSFVGLHEADAVDFISKAGLVRALELAGIVHA